jgi:hypothetical protein
VTKKKAGESNKGISEILFLKKIDEFSQPGDKKKAGESNKGISEIFYKKNIDEFS